MLAFECVNVMKCIDVIKFFFQCWYTWWFTDPINPGRSNRPSLSTQKSSVLLIQLDDMKNKYVHPCWLRILFSDVTSAMISSDTSLQPWHNFIKGMILLDKVLQLFWVRWSGAYNQTPLTDSSKLVQSFKLTIYIPFCGCLFEGTSQSKVFSLGSKPQSSKI